ncbi:MAG: InlB B-repeat-containing protein, partial [Propionibacteriaceae bacterium]|nr:InlB B-repeat-containing protein [Propionibacteriaceae bacterium]
MVHPKHAQSTSPTRFLAPALPLIACALFIPGLVAQAATDTRMDGPHPVAVSTETGAARASAEMTARRSPSECHSMEDDDQDIDSTIPTEPNSTDPDPADTTDPTTVAPSVDPTLDPTTDAPTPPTDTTAPPIPEPTCIAPPPPSPDAIPVTTWKELNQAIKRAKQGETTAIRLLNDIQAPAVTNAVIPQGVKIILEGDARLIGADGNSTIVAAGELVINGITVTHNPGETGRGITTQANAVVTVASGAISGNHYGGGKGYSMFGGGIANRGSTVTILGGDITDNSSDGGAGIYTTSDRNATGHLVIRGCARIHDNGVLKRANADAFPGHGVMVRGDANLLMDGGMVYRNSSRNEDLPYTADGGGIAIYQGGRADIVGGVIGSLDPTGSADQANTAASGGGIVVFDTGELHIGGDAHITGNRVATPEWRDQKNSEGNGGGVRVDGPSAKLRMDGGSITNNTGLFGGGINAKNGATVDISGGQISGNHSTWAGGGIYADKDSHVTLSGEARVAGNTSPHGAGMFITSGSDLTASDHSAISQNTAEVAGGGVWVGSEHGPDATLTMNGHARIDSNTAAATGGGIHAAMGGVVVLNDSSSIETNTSHWHGGGIFLGFSAKLTIPADSWNSGVSGNVATCDGGGIFADLDSELTSEGMISINGNTAGYRGGGLYREPLMPTENEGPWIPTLLRADLRSNQAEVGGGAYVDGGAIDFSGSTIEYNTADLRGGGIAASWTDLIGSDEFDVAGNTAPKGAGMWLQDSRLTLSRDAHVAHNETRETPEGEVETLANTDRAVETDCGGGIWAKDTDITLRGPVSVSHNHSQGNGGGLCMRGGSLVVEPAEDNPDDQGSFNNNAADIDGGAMFLTHVNAAITSLVTNNAAHGEGGGIYAQTNDLSRLEIGESSSFVGNSADGWSDRAPEWDTVYANMVHATEWTEPATQGYNNHDIGFGQITHTVVFTDWDDTELSRQTVADGDDAVEPTQPTHRGYTFDGWSDDFTRVSRDLTLQAKFTLDEYEITYDFGDGVAPEEANPSQYNVTELPLALTHQPQRPGYIFAGWVEDDSRWRTPIDTIPTGTTGDVHLSALWQPDSPSPAPSDPSPDPAPSSPSPSVTVTPTMSVTPSATPTISITPSASSTPTASVTPTQSVTPSATPTISTTPSTSSTPTASVTTPVTTTPSISLTPSATPTVSATPTTSVTPS